jgi:CxxC-x17-CxxC domain-containing protein
VPRAPRDGFHAPREGFHPPRAALPEAPPAPKAKKPRPAFDVTCIQCGTAAQVPFKPIEGRDVFCQPCYRARRGTPAAVATEPALEPVGVESPEPTEQGPSA